VVVFTELMNTKTTFLMMAALAAAALTAAPFLTQGQAFALTQTGGTSNGGTAGTAINFASPFGYATADGGNADSSANAVCAIVFTC
jgi:hypothetical protein